MRTGLVFGGRSVEHHVSIRSARTVLQGLEQAGHDVVCLGIDEDGVWHDPAASRACLDGNGLLGTTPGASAAASVVHLLDARVDVIFPIVHGTFGEDGALQGLCEMLDVPYVGCGVGASAAAMDKLMSKRLFESAGIPVVPWAVVTRRAFDDDKESTLEALRARPWPQFVKPAVGGSSVGCKKVDGPAQLEEALAFALRFDDVVLVEAGVKAREVEIAVLGADAETMQASVPGEIVPGNDFYDYEDKYLKDSAKLLAPAPVSSSLLAKLQDAAIRAMGAVGGAGLARVDFFVLPDESFYLNEINTLPGFTSVSMYPRLWGLSGVPLPQLVDRLVQLAVERHARRGRIQSSLRTFVASMRPSS